MDVPKLESALDSLHQHKVSIGQLSIRQKGKYVMSKLLLKIRETLIQLEGIRVPDEMEATKQGAVDKIRQTIQRIDDEYAGAKFTPKGEEVITGSISNEVDVIRGALNVFDDIGLAWLRQHN